MPRTTIAARAGSAHRAVPRKKKPANARRGHAEKSAGASAETLPMRRGRPTQHGAACVIERDEARCGCAIGRRGTAAASQRTLRCGQPSKSNAARPLRHAGAAMQARPDPAARGRSCRMRIRSLCTRSALVFKKNARPIAGTRTLQFCYDANCENLEANTMPQVNCGQNSRLIQRQDCLVPKAGRASPENGKACLCRR
ncbi:hypothetical protein DFR29_1209 [Tahibacter aquaticus]|uniref:Uncharacterized protein n=1 Tax=Tahibacter aquaticus TaxID=520092 RepID=A0A4R6YM72_9GAMM|nr:hypothetical protein DFR29_1209 [Tahibacter aquaticus]